MKKVIDVIYGFLLLGSVAFFMGLARGVEQNVVPLWKFIPANGLVLLINICAYQIWKKTEEYYDGK